MYIEMRIGHLNTVCLKFLGDLDSHRIFYRKEIRTVCPNKYRVVIALSP